MKKIDSWPMEKVNGWKELVDLDMKLESSGQEWIFRGQSSPKHSLKTTLERACDDFEIRGAQISWIEDELIKDFKRSCHLYATPVLPEQSDTPGWLALARHYGIPSRLLDFTYSLPIAIYFAAETEKAEPVVWAVNKTWLAEHGRKIIRGLREGRKYDEAWVDRKGWVYDKLLIERKPAVDFIGLLNPYHLNDRLAVQQGLFLVGSNVIVPFSTALKALTGSTDNVRIYQISSEAVRREILVRLYRIGVTRAALFPGLDGYAQSLRSKMLMLRRWGEVQRKWPSPDKGS